MPPIEIFPYHPDEDREAVEAIVRAGLRDQERLAAALTPPEDAGFFDGMWQRFQHALEQEPEGCWVAVDGDEVVGFMWTAVVRRWPFPHMVIDQLDIHPDHRGQGIGTQLLEHAIFLARSRPLPLVLGGLANNPARALFQRLGWVELPAPLCDDDNPNHFWMWWQGK